MCSVQAEHGNRVKYVPTMWIWIPMILASLGIVCSVAAYMHSLGRQRVAVVRIDDLMYQYQGMIDAQEAYKIHYRNWEHEIDSLSGTLKEQIDIYERMKSRLSNGQQRSKEQELALRKHSMDRRKLELAGRASKVDSELTQRVIRQVQLFADEYGADHGYDIVIGSGAPGAVLHFSNTLDITQDLLAELNRSYRGVRAETGGQE